ncbi:hypothetical protein N9003_01715 [bacterium]|nr:hypothetical protein [Mariniblastus sp.]MDB4396545.1 hypothetical protein [bacterium]
MLFLRKSGGGFAALFASFSLKYFSSCKEFIRGSNAGVGRLLTPGFTPRYRPSICIGLLFSLIILVAVPPDAHGQYATRIGLGNNLGSNVYEEHSYPNGWNTGSYISSNFGLYYSTELNGNNPWTVRYDQENRENRNFEIRANKLTLDLNERTHTILNGHVDVGDYFGNGAYLTIKDGTFDHDNSANDLRVGIYSNRHGRLNIDSGGRYVGWNVYNGTFGGSTGTITVSNGGFMQSRGQFWNGRNQTATANFNVSGSSSTFNNQGRFFNGRHGTGSVNVGSGGSFNNNGDVYTLDTFTVSSGG